MVPDWVDYRYENFKDRGTRVAHSVKRLTLDISSDPALRAVRPSPDLGWILGRESA